MKISFPAHGGRYKTSINRLYFEQHGSRITSKSREIYHIPGISRPLGCRGTKKPSGFSPGRNCTPPKILIFVQRLSRLNTRNSLGTLAVNCFEFDPVLHLAALPERERLKYDLRSLLQDVRPMYQLD